MKRKLYSIRDEKAGTFNPPCVFDNDAVATRSFGDLVTRDKDTLLAAHSEDFALYRLGEFDLESGALLSSVEDVVILARGSDFVK